MEFGYNLTKLIEETKRISLKNYRKMRKHVKQFADSQTELIRNVWTTQGSV